MINGESVLSGVRAIATMWKSSTIIRGTDMERLPNVHPGDILREDYLAPLGMSPYRLARKSRSAYLVYTFLSA